jgi:DNA-binding NarL/FixJ family response regulator
MSQFHLLLLDDHTLFRVMLSRLLETDSSFRVVADCASITQALEALAVHRVDLVLLDYDLGQRETGFHFIRQAREAGFAGRILLVTAGMSDADCLSALGQGVCGIFLKHSEPDLLAEAIRKVLGGQTWIDQRCLQSLFESITSGRAEPRPNDLTERERQVLKRVFTGLSNRQIGAELNISEASVKSALQQLFSKTGVRTRSQLVRVALEEYGQTWGLHP